MRKGEVTRQRIIAVAAPLFNQRGYEGCSMHDVMQAAGLEKGGLYRHFSTKEELAAAVFRYSAQRIRELRGRDLDSAHGALGQLRSMVARFVESGSGIAGGCPLLNTAVDADDGNPVLRALVADEIRNWKQRIEATVEQGLKSGEIRPGTSPAKVANAVVAALEGAVMITRLERTRTALEDARDSLEALFDRIASN